MKKAAFTFIFLSTLFNSFSQNYIISGYVKDSQTGEDLVGATVYIMELKSGVSTNVYGFYSLTIPKSEISVKYSYIGYGDVIKKVKLTQNIKLNIELTPIGVSIEEFEVFGKRADENTKGTQMGTVELDVEQIKTLPAFMGEVDIIKTLQLLPGVQSSGEGNTGFYVRGGGSDQNLILLDGAVVYNAAHLFGFFSVFNSDAIKNVNLIKGGMPANYGGRLSSVLDISLKEGNSKKFQADGGIGLIASRLTLQAPIVKNKSSFIVSARRTYIDVLTEPFISDTSKYKGSGYYFYDLNAKINYNFSDKDRVFLSGYFGKDVFSFSRPKDDFRIDIPWGNATASLRWNHLFNEKLFLNTTAIYSSYNFKFNGKQDKFSFGVFSGIRDWNLKADFNYFPNLKHTVKFGAEYTYHTFIPSNVSVSQGDTDFDFGDVVKLYANEGAIYILDDYKVSELFQINFGLRGSIFQHIGPFTRYNKDESGKTTGTTEYKSGEVIKTYIYPEPRVTARYSLDENSSIKMGLTHNYQYMHLVSAGGNSLPTDIWVPTTNVVNPQSATQINLGYFRNFKKNSYETSIEIYYKDLKNLVEFQEGKTNQDGIKDNLDNQLTFGKGYSYGMELFVKKSFGKLTGWIGYTLSKTDREFKDLNNGEKYAAKFDRRHDLSIVAGYKLNKKWTFGAVFVYATGNSITLPYTKYFINGQLLVDYGPRNSYRMIPYHRADISATYYLKKYKMVKDVETGEMKKKKKRFTSNWNFSIYNLYNRKNPYFIYFDYEGDFLNGSLDVNAKQVSLFPILPSITWNFNF